MTTKEFIKGLAEESEDNKKIATLKTPEEVYDYIKSKGVTDTYEEFIGTVKDYSSQMEKLSEKDLEDAAGGFITITTSITITLITTTNITYKK